MRYFIDVLKVWDKDSNHAQVEVKLLKQKIVWLYMLWNTVTVKHISEYNITSFLNSLFYIV